MFVWLTVLSFCDPGRNPNTISKQGLSLGFVLVYRPGNPLFVYRDSPALRAQTQRPRTLGCGGSWGVSSLKPLNPLVVVPLLSPLSEGVPTRGRKGEPEHTAQFLF